MTGAGGAAASTRCKEAEALELALWCVGERWAKAPALRELAMLGLGRCRWGVAPAPVACLVPAPLGLSLPARANATEEEEEEDCAASARCRWGETAGLPALPKLRLDEAGAKAAADAPRALLAEAGTAPQLALACAASPNETPPGLALRGLAALAAGPAAGLAAVQRPPALTAAGAALGAVRLGLAARCGLGLATRREA